LRLFGSFLAVFPAPHRPVQVRDTLSLVLFLTMFGGSCFLLETLNKVLFVRPEAFFLTAVILWLWWLFLAGATGLSPVRAQTALWIRFVMAAGFIVVLAEPRAVRTREILSVVYAVDVSDSIGQQAVDSALEFVARQVSEKPAMDEAGLVLFGAEAVVELPPRITFPFDGVVTSQVRRDATDLAEALSLSGAMIPAENNGRIVLISDGTSTEGNVAKRLDELSSRSIVVDVLPVNYRYENEVWVEQLELPQQANLEQDYEASVLVSSLGETVGKLVLRENGRILASNTVNLKSGLNQFSLPIRVDKPGYYEYQAAIELADGEDNLSQNNTAENFLFVEGTGRVLIVTAPGGDPREWQPLFDSIKRDGRIVEQKTAYGFPDSTLALMPYDIVIFVNVPVNAFVPAQLRALQNAVRDVGIGFLMVGGPESFGPGGYHRSPVEEILPVSMDIEQQELLQKGALVIILHTCEFADGNTWGKRITNQAIRVLSGHDEVGVLLFDNETNAEQWLFRLTPAANFPRLVTLVNRARIGDMPTFATTMEMGLAGLAQSDATIRRMVIISDGDPSAPTDNLLEKFLQEKIAVSTVTVSPHGESDRTSMKRIADATGGTAYTPDNPAELPSIFVKEARTLKRSMIQEGTISPQPGTPSLLLLSLRNSPPLHGHILTALKPRAESVLLAPIDESDEALSDTPPAPLLARWKYGLGTTSAFTSDFTTRWGRDWVTWDKFDSIVSQLLTSLSRVRKPTQLRLWTHFAGSEAVIVAEDFAEASHDLKRSFAELSVIINGPDDFSETLRLHQIAPRRYETRLPLPNQGKYQVIVQGTGNDRTESVTGGFIVSYSAEYLRFRSNPIMLKEIQEKTEGKILQSDSPSESVFGERLPRSSTRPIFDWLLIFLAMLLPIDVAVRRIYFDWTNISRLVFRSRDKQDQQTTLESLLETKQETVAQLDAARAVSTTQTRTDKASSKQPRNASPGQQLPVRPSPPEASSTKTKQPDTTLAKLLAIKRQQQTDGDSQSASDSN
jgi:uncharacterized membrane protein